eukprot:8940822-Pyramimonas_sp.AAC.1
MVFREPYGGFRWPQDTLRSILNRGPVVQGDRGWRQGGPRKSPEVPRIRPGGLQKALGKPETSFVRPPEALLGGASAKKS